MVSDDGRSGAGLWSDGAEFRVRPTVDDLVVEPGDRVPDHLVVVRDGTVLGVEIECLYGAPTSSWSGSGSLIELFTTLALLTEASREVKPGKDTARRRTPAFAPWTSLWTTFVSSAVPRNHPHDPQAIPTSLFSTVLCLT